MTRVIHAIGLLCMLWAASACTPQQAGQETSAIPEKAEQIAESALDTWQDEIIATIGDLVRFKTVKADGIENADNEHFQAMTAYLRDKAAALGLEFEDYGAVVVIALGNAEQKVGIITHGDVQPADPDKWFRSPFSLDLESDPGRLVGRGTEDDKGPIAIAMYAMKELADRQVALKRRIELIISYTEESNWQPMQEFLAGYDIPQINIALDGRYPVVTAEKGWCLIRTQLPLEGWPAAEELPKLEHFTGGSFLSQVPEDGYAIISGADEGLENTLRQRADAMSMVTTAISRKGDSLSLTVTGKSAHSSDPASGVNGITHLAALLEGIDFAPSAQSWHLRFINDLVGTGHYADQFGAIAYAHEFMGPLTLSLSMVEETDNQHVVSINLRRPSGKEGAALDSEIQTAVNTWKAEHGLSRMNLVTFVSDPHLIEDAPHIPVLLDVYSHFTGTPDPQPMSSGGGTHARLVPNGVQFGPHFPYRAYTGHTEHEYMALDELRLNVKMYTAALWMLAAAEAN